MRAKRSKTVKYTKITLWAACPILILSIAMFFIFNLIYDGKVKKSINLSKDSLFTKKVWKDIPLPIYEKIYFFNITNVDAFLDGNNLNVQEVGPYTYESRWTKHDITWHFNNTVSYREVKTFYFVPELSNGTQDDLIYSFNGPLIIASNLVRNADSSVRKDTSSFFLFKSETLVTKKSVRELVYEGYHNPIIANALRIKKDIPYKDGKFSWLYGKNATDDGFFTVFTGEDDASKTNFINNWNGEENLTFWKEDSCNSINVTSIETGPPILYYIDSYSFFEPTFCRTFTFKYNGDTTHYDISAKRFIHTSNLFANSTENPENSCFEVNKQRPSGVLDISPCHFGSPVFISNPHFYLADLSFLNIINGLNPNAKEHGSHIDVEPQTGVTIDVAMRFQINIEVNKVDNIVQFRKSKDGIYPVFWVELSLSLDEPLANFLKKSLRLPKVVVYSVLICLCGICIIAIFVSLIVLALTPKTDSSANLINKTDSINGRMRHFLRKENAVGNAGHRALQKISVGAYGVPRSNIRSHRKSSPNSPVQMYPFEYNARF